MSVRRRGAAQSGGVWEDPRLARERDAVQAETVVVDTALREVEGKWGQGRLPRLVSADTLLGWQRGWAMWCEAVASGCLGDVRSLGPKVVAALGVMDREATARGHAALDPTVLEAVCEDGRVLVVVQDPEAVQHALRAAAGRELVVWTMGELALMVRRFEQVQEVKRVFPGALVERVVRREAGSGGGLSLRGGADRTIVDQPSGWRVPSSPGEP